MKKILLVSIFIWGFSHVYSQTQITLTFTAKDSVSQNPVSLDSVYVKNLTESCDTLLYGPAPVLILPANWPVGIGGTGAGNPETFILKQNYPNPFQEYTYVSIYRDYEGSMNLMLFDGLGTKVAEYHNEFEKGFHSFMISSSGNKVLILVASDDKNYRSIKIVCTGQGNKGSFIRYLGLTHQSKKSVLLNPANSGFIFYLGNQMMYTGYAAGYHDNTMFDTPISSTVYIFNIILLSNPVIPTVTTASMTNITQTTATGGGNVTSDGGANVTTRGVCWDTSPNPTTANSYTTDGNGTGIFVSNLTGLIANMLYYVRAYATNSIGTAYGNEVTFSTLPNPVLPTVTTTAATNISQTTATSGGNVTSDGGATVTVRGVCWSTSSNPTTADSHTSDGNGTGIFVSNITGLTSNTSYYVRAYATNSVGTSYGYELTFTTLSDPCSGIISITYAGQIYNIIPIGSQCWFKENLNVGLRIIASQSQTNNSIIEKYCYDNLDSNCDIYGGLYQWDEMMQYITTQGVQGICPTGWHLPTDAEFTTLTTYCGGESVAGGALKEAGFVHWMPPNTGATNSSGFTALPGGYSNYTGATNSLGWEAYFWSSTESSSTTSWRRSLSYTSCETHRYPNVKTFGFSVRCLKN